MADPLTIIGILVDQRAHQAPKVQEVITRYGSDIVGRFGIPSPSKEDGLITLVYQGKIGDAGTFFDELEEISGVQVQMVSFKQ